MGEERRELRVLAVDDDPRMRFLLAEMLAHTSCRVLTASDGAEAMEILEEEPVDLLITDYEMPRMNGLDLIRWSKARFPRMTAVMITGQDSQAIVAQGRECGAFRVLAKPFSVQQLAALMAELRTIGLVPSTATEDHSPLLP
ncbi:MAG: response regulator [candidate division NC10 bacterium]|nr:response regulator [candidate division NC10 bacterium]MBI2455268.1 response regulator [candidate division NC10 bacterium]MBI3122501.1 response regulator [candidate division NC10 bacterium]